jgi:D-glycero-D-manno-heptose 1,7-bisphosphate phosphatase
MKNKAIFLDRDGVLNQSIIIDGKPYPPNSLNELIIPTDVLDALNKLKLAGFLLICVTNQPDVARNKSSKSSINEINEYLKKHLGLDEILVCFHDDQDNCLCRKPKPGLIIQACENFNIDLAQSFMIGDRWRDIDAGHNAGCKTILIQHQYQEQLPIYPPHFVTSHLYEAAEWILNHKKKELHCEHNQRVESKNIC